MFHRWTRHHLKPINDTKIVKIGSLLAEIGAELLRRNGPPKGGRGVCKFEPHHFPTV